MNKVWNQENFDNYSMYIVQLDCIKRTKSLKRSIFCLTRHICLQKLADIEHFEKYFYLMY